MRRVSIVVVSNGDIKELEKSLASINRQKSNQCFTLEITVVFMNKGIKWNHNEHRWHHTQLLVLETEKDESPWLLGINQSTGDYVAFMEAGEEWKKTRLEYQIHELNSQTGVKWVGGENCEINGKMIKKLDRWVFLKHFDKK